MKENLRCLWINNCTVARGKMIATTSILLSVETYITLYFYVILRVRKQYSTQIALLGKKK